MYLCWQPCLTAAMVLHCAAPASHPNELEPSTHRQTLMPLTASCTTLPHPQLYPYQPSSP